MEVYPDDLFERIKNYVEKNGEKWVENKHFFYIDCTVEPQKLIFRQWDYKVKKPSLDDIGVIVKEIREEQLNLLSHLPDVQKNLE